MSIFKSTTYTTKPIKAVKESKDGNSTTSTPNGANKSVIYVATIEDLDALDTLAKHLKLNKALVVNTSSLKDMDLVKSKAYLEGLASAYQTNLVVLNPAVYLIAPNSFEVQHTTPEANAAKSDSKVPAEPSDTADSNDSKNS